MDALKARLAIARDELLDVVNSERDKMLRKGEPGTSIKIPTLDGNRVMVVYQERFRGLDAENVPALKGAFGTEYDLLCEVSTKIGLRKGATLKSLETTIGKAAFAKLQGLLDVSESVAPRKGAFDQIARLFAEGTKKSKEKAEDLTQFVDATVSSPQVRAK